jgi:hypothetical protein
MLNLTCSDESIDLFDNTRVARYGFKGFINTHFTGIQEVSVVKKIVLNVGTDPNVSYEFSLA